MAWPRESASLDLQKCANPHKNICIKPKSHFYDVINPFSGNTGKPASTINNDCDWKQKYNT